ncbi:MAG: hypothetical protein J5965_00710 [Aeriscardovia sp.]|nr:hypothetical protein [Aeriscardovia sp.]
MEKGMADREHQPLMMEWGKGGIRQFHTADSEENDRTPSAITRQMGSHTTNTKEGFVDSK